MDRSLTALAFFIAVGLAAALLWPVFMDWEEERANLEATMAEILGGPVALEGDVSVRILPSPRLTATEVSLADAEGRLTVSGADLRAEISLWPLFLKRTVVNRVILDGGDIHLSGNGQSLRSLADEMAGRMSLGEGRFRYLVAPDILKLGEGDDAIILVSPHLELWSDSDGTLIRFSGRALEDTLHADATFRPQSDGPWRVDVRANYLEDVLEFRSIGELDRFYNGASFVGEFTLIADDIHEMTGWQGDGPSLDARGIFRAIGPDWFVDPTQITLGTTQAMIEGQVNTNDGLNVTAELSSTLADLDTLGLEISLLRGFFTTAGLGGDELGLPSWINGHLTANADGLMLNRRVIRGLGAGLALQDGALHLNTFSAVLPGGTDVEFHPRADRARGLYMTSASLRSLLSWLEYDVENIGAEHLQEMTLLASISEGSGPLQVEIAALALDGGEAQGTLARANNGALTIQGTFSDLDLDAYSPADMSGTFIDRMQALANLFGANDGAGVDVTGTDVILAGAALSRLHLVMATQDGVLGIDEAAMDFAGSGSLVAQGSWAIDGSSVDLRIEGEDVDPILFEGLPLAPSAPAQLNITFATENNALNLEGTVQSSGLEIDLAGSKANDTGEINGQVNARSSSSGALAAALGLEEFVNSDGTEQFAARWSGPWENGELSAALELSGLSLRAQGQAGDLFSADPRADLGINLRIENSANLLVQMGGPQESDLDEMALVTEGQLIGREDGWRYQSSIAHVDDVPVAMDLSVGEGGLATLNGSLRLARVSFDNTGIEGSEPSTLAWSTEQFDLDWMAEAAANLNITIDALELGGVLFTDVGFHLGLGSGALVIEQARGTMGDGLLTGSGSIRKDGPAITLSMDMAGEGLPAAQLTDPAGLPNMVGDLTLSASLEGRGRSPFDLVASLAGRLDIDLGDGAFETINMSHLETSLQEVRTRIALREVANQSLQQGNTALARLSGLVPVQRGVLNLGGLEGATDAGAINLQGSLDLRSQIVDVQSIFQVTDKETGTFPVTVSFRGLNGDLATSIDVTQLQAGIEDRLADTHLELLSEDDLPEDLQQLLQAYEEAYPIEDVATP